MNTNETLSEQLKDFGLNPQDWLVMVSPSAVAEKAKAGYQALVVNRQSPSWRFVGLIRNDKQKKLTGLELLAI